MTREFWVWQWADGEFGSFIWPSKDSATLPHRHEVGHPIQLVPKTDIETAQKDAPAWHDAPTCVGLWVRRSEYLVDALHLDGAAVSFLRQDKTTKHLMWYGPIPADVKEQSA